MSEIRRETVTIPNTAQRIPYRFEPVTGDMIGRIVALDRLNHAPDPIPEQELRESLEDLGTSLIAAVSESGELMGYAALQVVMDEGYLTHITVKERYRRKGLGTELVNVFLRFGQVHLTFLSLAVRERETESQQFFEHLGFAPVETRKELFGEPDEDGVIMTLKFGGKNE